MGSSWFPDGFAIDVEDPGYGRLQISGDHDEWQTELAGSDVGRFLADVTARALGTEDQQRADDPGWVSTAPAFITAAAARRLLPAMQCAVILAGSGTDKFGGLFVDRDQGPEPPVCARCGEGSVYSGYPLGSPSCEQYGHQPFGCRRGISWEQALELYAGERSWWEARQRHASRKRDGA